MSYKITDDDTNLQILDYYEQFSKALDDGVSIENIRALLIQDLRAFVKDANEGIADTNKYINDMDAAMIAFLALEKENNIYLTNGKRKRNFFDYCLDEKEEFDKMLDDGVSYDNITNMFNYDYSVFLTNRLDSFDIAIEGVKTIISDQDEIESFALDAFSQDYNNPSSINKKNYLNKKLALRLIKKQQIDNN